MACFHPNHVVVRDGVSTFLGRADFLKADDLYYDNAGNFHALIPCGTCMGCRLDRSRVWADRMLLELQDNDNKAIFVTLTYDNDHLPRCSRHIGYHRLPDAYDYDYFDDDDLWVLDAAGVPSAPATLSVRDTQLFFKRLRKAFPDRKLRYFLAGEYGPKTNRPHYHAIIFGLTLSDFRDCRILKFNGLGQPIYKSKTMDGIWKNGFCSLAPVNWNTCAYVSRYTMKKIYKSDDASAYSDGQTPPFCTMSRRPGIGLAHADDLLKKGDKAFVRDENGVHEVYLGRPFLRSASRLHLNAIFDAPASDLDKVRKAELPAVTRLYARQKDRACNSVQRTVTNLAVTGKCVCEFYEGKERHFLERLKLLPERGDLFAQTSARKPGEG